MWTGPAVLAAHPDRAKCIWIAWRARPATGAVSGAVEPKQVGMALFGPYVLGVELASMLLLAGLVGAYHLGRRKPARQRRKRR